MDGMNHGWSGNDGVILKTQLIIKNGIFQTNILSLDGSNPSYPSSKDQEQKN